MWQGSNSCHPYQCLNRWTQSMGCLNCVIKWPFLYPTHIVVIWFQFHRFPEYFLKMTPYFISVCIYVKQEHNPGLKDLMLVKDFFILRFKILGIIFYYIVPQLFIPWSVKSVYQEHISWQKLFQTHVAINKMQNAQKGNSLLICHFPLLNQSSDEKMYCWIISFNAKM